MWKKILKILGRKSDAPEQASVVVEEAMKPGADLHRIDPKTTKSLYSRLLKADVEKCNSDQFSQYVTLLQSGLDDAEKSQTTKSRKQAKKTRDALLTAVTKFPHADVEATIALTNLILDKFDAKDKKARAALDAIGEKAKKFGWMVDPKYGPPDEELKTLRTKLESVQSSLKAKNFIKAADNFRTAAKNATLCLDKRYGLKFSDGKSTPAVSSGAGSAELPITIDGVGFYPRDAINSLQDGAFINDDVVRLQYNRMAKEYEDSFARGETTTKVAFASPNDAMRMAQKPAATFTFEIPEDEQRYMTENEILEMKSARGEFAAAEEFRKEASQADYIFIPLNDQKLTEEQLRNPDAEYKEGGKHWRALIYDRKADVFYLRDSLRSGDDDAEAKRFAENLRTYFQPTKVPMTDERFARLPMDYQGPGCNCALYMEANFKAALEGCKQGEMNKEHISLDALEPYMTSRKTLRGEIGKHRTQQKPPTWKLPTDISAEVKTTIAGNVSSGLSPDNIGIKAPSYDFSGKIVGATKDFLFVQPDYFQKARLKGEIVYQYSPAMQDKLALRRHDTDPLRALPIFCIPRKDASRGDVSNTVDEAVIGQVIEAKIIGDEGRQGSVNILSLKDAPEQEEQLTDEIIDLDAQSKSAESVTFVRRKAEKNDRLHDPFFVDERSQYILFRENPNRSPRPDDPQPRKTQIVEVRREDLEGTGRDFDALAKIARKPRTLRSSQEDRDTTVRLLTAQELDAFKKRSSREGSVRSVKP